MCMCSHTSPSEAPDNTFCETGLHAKHARVCVAARAVDTVTKVPDIVVWSTLPTVAPRDGPSSIRFEHVTVCAADRTVIDAPNAAVRAFGPIGLFFKDGKAEVRSGHDDADRSTVDHPLSALHASARNDRVVACGHEDDVVAVARTKARVDVRWLQLMRDSSEMLLCHCFSEAGCTCTCPGIRRPEIHDASAALLRHLDQLEKPALGTLVMLYVLACARVFAPKEALKDGCGHVWHKSTAKAVSMAFLLLGNCKARWQDPHNTCGQRYMSVLAALPSAVLGAMSEPFVAEQWEVAMAAASTRQGSGVTTAEVRSYMLGGHRL